MIDQSLDVVRFAISLYLDISPDSIDPSSSLSDDLGLDPLDLVLVGLRFEELAQREFPLAALEHVVTVDDLVRVLRTWSANGPRRGSGVHRIAVPLVDLRPALTGS